jgi:hypothetical protein
MSFFQVDQTDAFFDNLIQNKFFYIRHFPDLSFYETLILAYLESLFSEDSFYNRVYLKTQ